MAAAWAWQLQVQLQQANVAMADYANRISDLVKACQEALDAEAARAKAKPRKKGKRSS